jgi:hypothetical protein
MPQLETFGFSEITCIAFFVIVLSVYFFKDRIKYLEQKHKSIVERIIDNSQRERNTQASTIASWLAAAGAQDKITKMVELHLSLLEFMNAYTLEVIKVHKIGKK